MRFTAEDRFGLLDQPFQLFRSTRPFYGEVENVVSGSWHDLEVRSFDHSYSVSDDERRLLSCVQIAIPGGWPTLVIRPETGFTRVADLAVPDIAFEAEIFNRAFAVRCHDRAFASALVDPRMMEWLLLLDPRWSFEIDGRWIFGLSRSGAAVGDRGRARDGRVLHQQDPARGSVPVSGGDAAPTRSPGLRRSIDRRKASVRTGIVRWLGLAAAIASAELGDDARMPFDLEAYLARVGYEGPVEPTLEVLGRDPPRARDDDPVREPRHPARAADPARPREPEDKLVRDRRGGYCFEHNTLFAAVLEARVRR